MKVKPVKRPRVGRPSIEELDELIGLAISDNPVCITHCMNRWWPMYSEATEAMDISEAFKRMRVHLETKMRSNPDILLCYPDIANKVIWENQRVLAFRQGIMAHAIRDEQHVIWEASFITQETDCRIAIKEVKISLMQTLRIEVDLDKKIARIIESLWIYPDQQDFADSFHYAEDPAIIRADLFRDLSVRLFDACAAMPTVFGESVMARHAKLGWMAPINEQISAEIAACEERLARAQEICAIGYNEQREETLDLLRVDLVLLRTVNESMYMEDKIPRPIATMSSEDFEA